LNWPPACGSSRAHRHSWQGRSHLRVCDRGRIRAWEPTGPGQRRPSKGSTGSILLYAFADSNEMLLRCKGQVQKQSRHTFLSRRRRKVCSESPLWSLDHVLVWEATPPARFRAVPPPGTSCSDARDNKARTFNPMGGAQAGDSMTALHVVSLDVLG